MPIKQTNTKSHSIIYVASVAAVAGRWLIRNTMSNAKLQKFYSTILRRVYNGVYNVTPVYARPLVCRYLGTHHSRPSGLGGMPIVWTRNKHPSVPEKWNCKTCPRKNHRLPRVSAMGCVRLPGSGLLGLPFAAHQPQQFEAPRQKHPLVALVPKVYGNTAC